MNKLTTLTLLAVALAAPSLRAEGPWMMRLRAVSLQPSNKSDAFGEVPADAIHVNNKVIPEVDFTYFFNEKFSAELVLTIPQEQDVTLAGTKIGTFKHLPPTLTAQYHFRPGQTINPYVGAGLNLTLISDVKLAGGELDLSKTSFGAAVGAGVDIQVARNCYLNFDVKYVQIKADVKAAADGSKVTTVKVDPLLLGVGVGFKF